MTKNKVLEYLKKIYPEKIVIFLLGALIILISMLFIHLIII